MSTYRERREDRASKLEEWADRRRSDATRVFRSSEKYRGDTAFNTQPGHIPERARLIAREDNAFRSLSKASDMASRAGGIRDQLDRSIYSDDPDATEALTARIAELEAKRDAMKARNAEFRKANAARLKAEPSAYQRDLMMPYQGYSITNMTGNIARLRKRIGDVVHRQKTTEAAEQNGGVLVKVLTGRDFARITFTEYPGRAATEALKAAGWYYQQGGWSGQPTKLPPTPVGARSLWESISAQIAAQMATATTQDATGAITPPEG